MKLLGWEGADDADRSLEDRDRFGTLARGIDWSVTGDSRGFYFPHWYPALIFALALAGVAALKFVRRFTLRSAIIATSVIAALLGMVVAL